MKPSELIGPALAAIIIGLMLTVPLWVPRIEQVSRPLDYELGALNSLYAEQCAGPGYGEHADGVKARCIQINERREKLSERKRAATREEWEKEVDALLPKTK